MDASILTKRMNKPTIPLFIFIITTCLLGLNCTSQKNWEESDPDSLLTISLSKLYTYTLHSDLQTAPVLGRITPKFQINDAGDVFAFYDQTQNQFILTDTLGVVKTIFGKEGRGPDEFVKIQSYIFAADDELYAYDTGQHMVKIFDTAGNFGQSLLLEPEDVFVDGLSMVVRGEMIYFGILQIKFASDIYKVGSSPQLGAFNRKGEQLRIFGSYDSYSNQSNNYDFSPMLRRSRDGNRIYTVQENSFMIQGWNPDSGERVYFTRTLPPNYNLGKERININLSIADIKKKSIGNSLSVNVFESDEYVYLHYITLTEEWYQTSDHNEKEHYLSIFDKTGNLVGDIALPYQLGQIINNRLHLIINDDPGNYEIGVYELQVE